MNGTNGHDRASTNVSLSPAGPSHISETVVIQSPLSRRGLGPGLIVLLPNDLDLNGHEKTLDPPPLQKWAEEGYAVARILVKSDKSAIKDDLNLACDHLLALGGCQPKGNLGVICQ